MFSEFWSSTGTTQKVGQEEGGRGPDREGKEGRGANSTGAGEGSFRIQKGAVSSLAAWAWGWEVWRKWPQGVVSVSVCVAA